MYCITFPFMQRQYSVHNIHSIIISGQKKLIQNEMNTNPINAGNYNLESTQLKQRVYPSCLYILQNQFIYNTPPIYRLKQMEGNRISNPYKMATKKMEQVRKPRLQTDFLYKRRHLLTARQQNLLKCYMIKIIAVDVRGLCHIRTNK